MTRIKSYVRAELVKHGHSRLGVTDAGVRIAVDARTGRRLCRSDEALGF